MPVDTTQDRKAHLIRLPVPTSEEVVQVGLEMGMTFNAAVNLLVREALDARKQK